MQTGLTLNLLVGLGYFIFRVCCVQIRALSEIESFKDVTVRFGLVLCHVSYLYVHETKHKRVTKSHFFLPKYVFRIVPLRQNMYAVYSEIFDCPGHSVLKGRVGFY